MSFHFAQIEFEGPGLVPADLKDEPGVFVLLHCIDDGSYELLDYGQFERLRTSWNAVDFDYFQTVYPGPVSLAAHYCPRLSRQARRALVKAIRREYEQMAFIPDRQKALA